MTIPCVKAFVTDPIPAFSRAAFDELQTSLAAQTWFCGPPHVFDYDIEKEIDGLDVLMDGQGLALPLCERPWSDETTARIRSDVQLLLEALRLFSARSRLYLEIELDDEVVGTIESGILDEHLTTLLG